VIKKGIQSIHTDTYAATPRTFQHFQLGDVAYPDATHVRYIYIPTKLGDKLGANVEIHIPAPWSIWERKNS